MSAHTSGPWTFYADVPSTDPNWHIVTTANRLRVIANVHIEPGNATDLANARLIAATPELLDALVLADGFLANKGFSESDPLARGAIRAAIAKAAGEQP